LSKVVQLHGQSEILPMPEKCATKDNIENEKKRLGLQYPAFWFTCLVVWIFIIKQVMHFSVIITVLFTSASMTTHGSPVPPTSNPSFSSPLSSKPSHHVQVLPQFISVHQLVDVQEGSTAVLDCKVLNLGIQHTVSWMRSSDMSVLTVGGLVFSSDPRVGLVSPSTPGKIVGSWSLQIQEASPRDSGEYQCQVNSEPKESLDVTLVVRGEEEDIIDLSGDKEIYSVFKNVDKPDSTEPDLHIQNISKTGKSFISKPEKYEEEIEINVANIFTTEKPIPTANKIVLHIAETVSEAQMNETKSNIIKAVKPETTIPTRHTPSTTTDTILKEYSENSKPEANTAAPYDPPSASDAAVTEYSDTNSLLIPMISLSLVVLIILVLGSVRGFYSRYVKTRQAPARSRSSTRTIDSRRSSVSRSSDDSVYSHRRMRRKARELEIEKERMMIYDEIRHKARLSPLIEVIEPTPPLDRRSPIFLMTSLDMLGISDDSEYEADRSDATGNTKISEDENIMDSVNADHADHNCEPSEPMAGDTSNITSKYETLRTKIESYLGDHGLGQRQGVREEEGNAERRPRTKLVDNINTYL